ncbi:MAG: opioid growth factor receptor [SAR86 cluster bacterium SAR86A]|uniref:Opioid growth factor receptor n=1 Tax=SAR86 cluster bacterium SAR86A TaxID=1123866 RepID=J4KS84_9GAMM|nr:MAG: opioid growth factor receptor [SAR86 cluster bacterium SAR86A]
MNFENFLTNIEPDYKNRFLNDIWNFTDEDIEHTHDFIQLLFPLNEQSESVFHGYCLNTKSSIINIKSNDLAKSNIVTSSKWFLSFLERNTHWRRKHDHNYLRITRIIKSLRLLVSDEEANKFYESFIELIDESLRSKINLTTLSYWENA